MIQRILFALLLSSVLIACNTSPKEEQEAVQVASEEAIKAEVEEKKAEEDSIKAALALAEKEAEAEAAAKKAAEEKAKKEAEEKAKAAAAKKRAAEKAKQQAKPKPKVVSKKPVIKWERKLHQFGLIEQGESVSRKFYFTNEGNAPLVIKDVSATCGCTRPGYPFVPIKPGEESYISVVFNSKGKYGDQEPTVTVVTNASPSTHTLKMKGKINAELEVADPVPVTEGGR